MDFFGRRRELGTLRRHFDAREPALIQLSGPAGIGKSTLARRAVEGIPHLRLACPPLPDPDIREAFHRLLQGLPAEEPDTTDPLPGWTPLLRRLLREVARGDRPWVLILDDAHRLTEARSRAGPALRDALAAGRHGPPLHVVLAGEAPGLPTPADHPVELHLRLGPLPFRPVQPRLPGRTAVERLRAYAIFGGFPRHLLLLDTRATMETNVRRVILDPGAPLAHRGLELLERSLQTPSRYAALLATLGRGEAGWGELHAGVRDLTASGQVAPYLARLEEMGLLEVRRSLDAPPRSRSRRYRLMDPFVAFWFRCVLPRLDRLGHEDGSVLLDELATELDHHVATVFPAVCRQFMEHDVMEHLAANARELGSLWGDGYEMSVAGILASGVPFYGSAHWDRPPEPAFLTRLDEGIRETRYGYGRELRLRALFARMPFPPVLERAAASRRDTILVGPRELAGEE